MERLIKASQLFLTLTGASAALSGSSCAGEENDLSATKPKIAEHLKDLMREAHVPNPDFPVLPGE